LAEAAQRGKARAMKLAILETGRPPGDLQHRFGSYPQMMTRLIGDGFSIEIFDVQAGALPEVGAHDAIVVMGSPAGVYDPLPWIAPLMDFIRAADRSKMIGVCFGHQVMAQALGGEVEKSEKGWGTGLHQYKVTGPQAWTNGEANIAIPASHQDQVIVQPPNSEVVARSDFTPFAALGWKDRPAISFQFHPEFTVDYAKALIDMRRDRIPNPDAAIASLDGPNDSQRVGGWIRRFLAA
jgi:GMP synthase-like glutamine amidotransferase